MIFPFDSLSAHHREFGLIVAVIIGFAFGFVLERAGFGRSPKLAAQFYLYDMTVFKVMFGAIVTACLGIVVFSQLGLVELRTLSNWATSETFLWPMIVGGFLLGIGFIIAGYCPGTSAVAAASGNLDGLFTFIGVIIGSFIYSEAFPLFSRFHEASNLGHVYLYDLLHLPAPAVAAAVALMAILCFLGAEKVEQYFSEKLKRSGNTEFENNILPERHSRLARQSTFATFGALALIACFTLFLTIRNGSSRSSALPLSQADLGERVLKEPWRLRIIDLREREACLETRVPGSECVPLAELTTLALSEDTSGRDLILVGGIDLNEVPAAAATYPGRVFILEKGFEGWKSFALTAPNHPGPSASPDEVGSYRIRAALYSSLTGAKQAPPPPPPAATGGTTKKKGGGCSG
ncbi:MAG: hypothetical protein A2428_02345 [Bdellovibrionales bacterium RIFOXYC1_FULL_54_43]|nr:MAG: hypothetical protein A2428_02345 [Bdellovibrionales bacterium RIFOXYC1_FULL_54_43]OFZ84691.1 MAG: hypothetical protein A2603_13810 [Bdellovibrionales bacterium RIFOXYD1_FULL_55_31]